MLKKDTSALWWLSEKDKSFRAYRRDTGEKHKSGIIPTPAIACLAKYYKARCGIVISPHKTFGIQRDRVFNGEGYKLDDDIEEEIEDIIISSIDVNSHITGELKEDALMPLKMPQSCMRLICWKQLISGWMA